MHVTEIATPSERWQPLEQRGQCDVQKQAVADTGGQRDPIARIENAKCAAADDEHEAVDEQLPIPFRGWTPDDQRRAMTIVVSSDDPTWSHCQNGVFPRKNDATKA